jgi:hypothetical protein
MGSTEADVVAQPLMALVTALILFVVAVQHQHSLITQLNNNSILQIPHGRHSTTKKGSAFDFLFSTSAVAVSRSFTFLYFPVSYPPWYLRSFPERCCATLLYHYRISRRHFAYDTFFLQLLQLSDIQASSGSIIPICFMVIFTSVTNDGYYEVYVVAKHFSGVCRMAEGNVTVD